VVPEVGVNPIAAQVATQVAQVFILPLVIVVFIILSNRRDLMGNHRTGVLMNIGMVTALVFSLIMSYAAVKGLIDFMS